MHVGSLWLFTLLVPTFQKKPWLIVLSLDDCGYERLKLTYSNIPTFNWSGEAMSLVVLGSWLPSDPCWQAHPTWNLVQWTMASHLGYLLTSPWQQWPWQWNTDITSGLHGDIMKQDHHIQVMTDITIEQKPLAYSVIPKWLVRGTIDSQCC